MDIPSVKDVSAGIRNVISSDSPIKNEDLVHLGDRLTAGALLLSVVDCSQPFGRYGDIVEEAESHGVFRLSVMTRRSYSRATLSDSVG